MVAPPNNRGRAYAEQVLPARAAAQDCQRAGGEGGDDPEQQEIAGKAFGVGGPKLLAGQHFREVKAQHAQQGGQAQTCGDVGQP